MSRIVHGGVFLILSCLPGVGQDHSHQAVHEDSVTATARVVGQRYCHVDSESFAVIMDVDLELMNSTDQPVIVSRHVEPFAIRVAKNMEEAKRGDFEYEPNFDYFTSGKEPPVPTLGKAPDSKNFAVLAPGTSYVTRTSASVFGFQETAKSRRGLLARGTHVFQLGVDLWPYHWPYFDRDINPKDISERWREYGHLAVGTVEPDFTPFSIPDKFRNPPCPAAKH